MLLSVVIPVYNERGTIDEIIARVRASDLPFPKEIIVVDDGSNDGTRESLAALGPLPELRLILQERNRGKGAALREGFAAARGDIVLIQDADLEYDPADYLRLLRPLLDGKADVVYGSRFAGGESHRVLYFWHSLGNRALTFYSNCLTNLNLSDMETGYKAFRREVLDSLTVVEDRFGFEPEITAKVASLRCRVYEVGISYSGRTYEEGKKIGWKDGVKALWCITKYALSTPRYARRPDWPLTLRSIGGDAGRSASALVDL